MTLNEYLESKYQGVNINPLPDKNKKMTFNYIMEEIKKGGEFGSHVICICGKSEADPLDIFQKLEADERIQIFSLRPIYTFEGEHKYDIKFITDNKDLETACELIDNDSKVLEELIK